MTDKQIIDHLTNAFAGAGVDSDGRLHSRLAALAEKQGLLDVSYRTVDSPLRLTVRFCRLRPLPSHRPQLPERGGGALHPAAQGPPRLWCRRRRSSRQRASAVSGPSAPVWAQPWPAGGT